MNKVTEFYAKALADESSKAELASILGESRIQDASDEQLKKIGQLAEKLGYEITVQEAKDYLNGSETELGEEDLEAVAGGKGGNTYICNNGIGHADIL